MNKEWKPDAWDWVRPRAECQPETMFDHLKKLTDGYVAAHNALVATERQPEPRYEVNDNGTSFFVLDTRGAHYGSRRAAGIRIAREPAGAFYVMRDKPEPPAFTATLTFTDDGECRFKVGEELLQPWQLLRRMLEPLFYPGYDE